ncbi:DUF3179 domain-containing (seleno)protein [Pseudomaricurvus alkylphenolicus]|uniref:DUF3179 domain-containing (seleno)protein n=1 Tax=Pseudomaricurvus alkylphenolicus TaxID=1306991 RepID=UPI00197F96E2|nr:DUF3179 domain-containing (seleno)protein [Pseudomaricurvus alkylphenolicus]
MMGSMIIECLHWLTLAVGTFFAYIYFRDLGDVTQALMHVERKNMMRAIRQEPRLITAALGGTGVAALLHVWSDAGVDWVFYSLACANVVMVGFVWGWLHIGLRNQQDHATFYSIEEADHWVRPEESVIVIDHQGEARAHPDYHIKRPHLAGTPEGLAGENVIMTYCCMTHLGHAYKPEIDHKKLDLEVLAQHGNNLIMKDMTTGEPIQQVYGTRECDGRYSDKKMQEWPTYRMTYRGFKRAFPEGKVFLNKIPQFTRNPFLWLVDNIVEQVFLWGTIPHDRTEKLLFNTMDVEDSRLRRKEYVWGFNVGRDCVAYTESFIRDNGNLINTEVGGRDIVVAYDAQMESIGVYYNTSGQAASSIDFWGNLNGDENPQNRLPRVETVKAGLYWCVWVNYFSDTDLNRVGASAADSMSPTASRQSASCTAG